MKIFIDVIVLLIVVKFIIMRLKSSGVFFVETIGAKWTCNDQNMYYK